MVLRGFDLYWFRPDGNRKAKGMMPLPSKPISDCLINGQAIFIVEKDETHKEGRRMEFNDDGNNREFKKVVT